MTPIRPDEPPRMCLRKLLLLGAIFLGACDRPALKETATDNPHFDVDELFTHAGCTVYRFTDGTRAHYFARCTGSTSTETTRTESCGKNCRREVSDVIAVEVPK